VDVKAGAYRDGVLESPLVLGLVQGLPEADKMDWIIQKATELGVAWIQPVICERSVVRLAGERAERREAHWRRVAIAAAEQCGRTRIPDVRPTLGYLSWIAAPTDVPRWLLASDAPAIAAHAAASSPLEIIVGPEGGLAEREHALAMDRGCEAVSLGPRILRTETASIVALAAIHALWGDFRMGTDPGLRS
jgi:16S rRNA (uracil1498-N3)-methyltransferase